MAVDKDFVIKNGIEVNEDLIYGDASTQRVGIGLTTPGAKLEVVGDTVITGIASAGLAITSHDAYFTGFCTAIEGFNIGLGGTVFRLNAIDKKVGINSDDPTYTTDIRGPVSTGQTALFVFGDLEVTGNIRGTDLFGQIQDGGVVGFSTVNVSATLDAPDSDVYTLFEVEETGGNQWEYVVGGAPPAGIGFTENTVNPTLFLQRGKKYRFSVNAPGFPFFLKTEPTVGTGNQYLDGVEGNGPQVGIVTFAVPYNAPAQLFYQASNRAGMNGLINVVGIFTGFSDNLEVPGIATITQLDSTWLNVSGFSTLGGSGASATQFEVTGFSTLGNVSVDNINVSGVVTASQFIGIGRSSQTIEIGSKNDATEYQVGFSTAGTGYKHLYVDATSTQLTYQPSTSTLTASIFEGNLAGTASSSNTIQVDERNDNQNYQVGFVTANGNSFQTPFIDTDNTQFLYNPSTHTLIAGTFEGNVTGTATTATTITVSENDTDTNFTPTFCSGTGDVLIRVDNEFTYNSDTNLLTAGNFSGNGSALTNLNASNLSSGTVPGARGATAGETTDTFLRYNGTTKSSGRLYGGTTNPTNTIRLNFDGDLHATEFNGPLNGNATSADTVDTQSNSTDADQFICFVNSNNGTATPENVRTDAGIAYNPSSNLLTLGGAINATSNGHNFGNVTTGTISCTGITNSGNTTLGDAATDVVTINGSLNVTGDITAFQTSDSTLKTNTAGITSAMFKINQLTGYTFDWVGAGNSDTGILAQQVEALGLPGIVTTRYNSTTKTGYSLAVAYHKLIPILINALKELDERIIALGG